MSNTIEQKVVEMRFDNKNFEKNVSQSMGTLEKLKDTISRSTSGNSFENLTKAANKLDFSGASSAVEGLSNKFNLLEEIAVGAARRIGESIEQHIVSGIKKVSIDNISSGWERYAQKTEAVQTILSAIAEEDFGDTDKLEYTESLLEKLAWFSDETSYGFTDMTDNIAKFTAAGLDLDKSTEAMMGIATWAANSGQNASVAARAMYQLSQAMGMGSIQLVDWKSIEIANMATREVKELLLEYGAASGELTKIADGQYVAGQLSEKQLQNLLADEDLLEDSLITANNFRQHLTEEKWLTTDVFAAAMGEYASFSDALYKVIESPANAGKNLIASELIGYFDKAQTKAKETGKSIEQIMKEDYGVEVMIENDDGEMVSAIEGVTELGIRAMKSAQQARTFAQAIDAVKDASSTKWMGIFEKIFGNVEEATKLFTDLSEYLYNIFVEPLNTAIEVLDKWKSLGGRDLLFGSEDENGEEIPGILQNIKAAFDSLREAVGNGIAAVFPKKTTDEIADSLYNATLRFKEFTEGLKLTEEQSEKVSSVVETLVGFLNDFVGTIGSGIDVVKRFAEVFYNSFSKVFGDNFFGDSLSTISNAILAVFRVIRIVLDNIKPSENVISSLETIFEGLRSAIELLLKPFEWLKSIMSTIGIGHYDELKSFGEFLGGPLLEAILFIPSKIAEAITAISDFINTSEKFEKVKTVLGGAVDVVKGFFESFVNAIAPADSISESFTKIKDSISGFFKSIGEWEVLKDLKNGIKDFFDGIVEFFEKNDSYEKGAKVFANVKKAFEDFGKAIEEVYGKIKGWVDSNIDFDAIGDALSRVGTSISTAFTKAKEAVSDFFKLFNKNTGKKKAAYDVNKKEGSQLGIGPVGGADYSGRPVGDNSGLDSSQTLAELNEVSTLGERIYDIFTKIKEIAGKVFKVIKNVIKTVSDFLDEVGVTDWAKGKIEDLKNIFTSFNDAAETTRSGMEEARSATDKLKEVFKFLKETFKELIDGIAELLPKLGLTGLEIGAGAGAAGLGLGFFKFGGFLEGIGDGVYQLGKAAKKFGKAKEIKNLGEAIKGVLIAVGTMAIELAAAAMIFSKIDNTDNLLVAAGIMAGFIAEIGAIMIPLVAINNKTSSLVNVDFKALGSSSADIGRGLNGVALSIAAIGAAVLLIAESSKTMIEAMKLAGSPEEFEKTIDAISKMILDIALAASLMEAAGSTGGKIGGGLGIVGIGASVKIIAQVAKDLGEVQGDKLRSGIDALWSLTAIVSLLGTVGTSSGKLFSSSVGLLIVVGCVKIIANMAMEFAAVKEEDLKKGLGVVAVISGIMLALSLMASYGNSVIAAGAATVLMAVAMKLIIESILEVLAACGSIQRAGGTNPILVIGASAAALLVVAAALKMLAKQKSGLLEASAAMLIMSIALTGVANIIVALSQLASTDLSSLLIALGAFAAVLAALVIAAKLVSGPVAVSFLAFASAVALLGVGITLIANGISTLINTIIELAAKMSENKELIVQAITVMCESIVAAKEAIKEAVSTIISTILEVVFTSLLTMLEQIVQFGISLMETINNMWPQIEPVLLTFLENIWNLISTFLQETVLPSLGVIIEQIWTWVVTFIETTALPDIVYLLNLIVENIFVVLDTFVGLLDPFLNDLVTRIFGLLENILEQLTGFVALVLQKLEELGLLVLEVVFTLLNSIVEEVGGFVTNIITTIGSLANLLLDTVFGLLNRIVEEVMKFLLNVLNAISTVGNTALDVIFGLLNRIVKEIENTITNIIKAAERLWKELFRVANGIKNDIVQFIKDVIKDLKGLVNDIFDLLDDIRKRLTQFISDVIDDVAGLIEKLIKKVGFTEEDGLGNLILTEIETLFNRVIEDIGTFGPDFVQAALDCLKSFVDGIVEGTQTVLNGITDLMTSIINWIPTFVNDMMQAFVDLINGIAEAIETHAPEFWKAIKRLGKAIIDAILYPLTGGGAGEGGGIFGLGKTILEGIGSGLTGAWEGIKGTFASVGGWIKGAISGALDKAGEIGENLLTGIKEGAEGAWATVKGGFEKVGGWISGTFKNIFGIHSPSKVFAEFGRYLDYGLAEGVLDAAGDPVNATNTMANNVLDAMNSSFSNINDVLDEDFTPTITPVMDLSQVQNGVYAMDSMLGGYSDYSMQAAMDAQYSPYEDYYGEEKSSPTKSLEESIDALQNKFDTMLEKIGNLKVFLDSGELVGGITDTMDQALGRKAIYAGRGVM